MTLPRLGLAIVDEQHRFGVLQRLALRDRGAPADGAGAQPHLLMLSATPIPRTLAMSYLADLDVSVIDELPPGRSPVVTKLVAAARRNDLLARVRDEVAQGRQAYWVCPLVEEGTDESTADLTAATTMFEATAAALPELRLGLLHGQLAAREKSAVMEAFRAGEIDVLVATTVIEVGVDVPNATLMVIEHAQRFGLAQLHQLRGRVGRGARQSYCVLLYDDPLSELARARLRTIYETTDGFEVARRDLQLRGPGRVPRQPAVGRAAATLRRPGAGCPTHRRSRHRRATDAAGRSCGRPAARRALVRRARGTPGRMTLTELKYVVAVARERHFGRAADACFVSQPTLSVAIKKLEDELGVLLFERRSNEVTSTPAGERIIAQAQRVLDEAGRVKEIAKQGKDPLSGPLRVGVIYTVGPYLLPPLIRQLLRDAPQMPLLLNENYTVKLLELLKNGEIDVAILALPLPQTGMLVQPVYDEPFTIAVPRNHPWMRRKSVPSEDLKKETMLLLGAGHCFRDSVLEVCPELSRFSSNAEGIQKTFEGSSLETIRHMVASGARHHRAAAEFDPGEDAARFADRVRSLQAAGARPACRAGEPQVLHAPAGTRGAAQGHPQVPAAWRGKARPASRNLVRAIGNIGNGNWSRAARRV